MDWLMVNSEGITQLGRLLGRFSFFLEGMVLQQLYFAVFFFFLRLSLWYMLRRV